MKEFLIIVKSMDLMLDIFFLLKKLKIQLGIRSIFFVNTTNYNL